MLQEIDIQNWSKVQRLFESHILFRSILNPCAHAGIGTLTVDNVELPTSALYSIPMMTFLAGDSSTANASELIKSIPPFTVIVVTDDEWKNVLKNEWGERLVTNKRTHLDHNNLDIDHLRKLKKNLPEGYDLRRLESDVIPQISEEYTIPIRMYFGKVENLIKNGFGFCIMHGRKLVSYAYTPFPFINEFEIQVYTEESPEYRRKGLGIVVSAALIEYGLEKNLVPHWDAANEPSTKLALKLGYRNPVSWEAYYYKQKET